MAEKEMTEERQPNTELRFPEDSEYIDLKDAAAQVYEAYTRSREEGAAEIANVIRAFAASIQAEAQQQTPTPTHNPDYWRGKEWPDKPLPNACPEEFASVKATVDGSRNYWKERAEAAEKQLAEPRAQAAVCAEILEIMAVYHEQEKTAYGVDTPGGLEHMGDVWKLFSKWESELVAAALERAAEGKAQTPEAFEIHNRFCGENGEPCQVCRLKAEKEK